MMMKKRHWIPYLVTAVLVLALYFGSDILIKVRALNALSEPYPIAGTLLVAGIAWLLWVVVIGPVIAFCRLSGGAGATKARAGAALKELGRYKLCENDPDARKREMFSLWKELYTANLQDREKLPELLGRYMKTSELHRRSLQYIFSSSKAAAIGVVVSRNDFLDGLVLLVLQMRMIVTLARMHGYKPSLVFNTLCFGWVVANSLIFALMSSAAEEAAQDMVVEPVVDAMAGYVTEVVGTQVATSAGSIIPVFGQVLSKAAQIGLEAVMGALPVYVTGRVFLMRLEADAGKVDNATIVKIRKEGLKDLMAAWLRLYSPEGKGETAPAK